MQSKRIKQSCNICYNSVNSPYKCNECTFECCEECILSWTEKSRECPQCRKYKTYDLYYPDSDSEIEMPLWINQTEMTDFMEMMMLPPPPPLPEFDEFGQYIEEHLIQYIDEHLDEHLDEQLDDDEIENEHNDDDEIENEFFENTEYISEYISESDSESEENT